MNTIVTMSQGAANHEINVAAGRHGAYSRAIELIEAGK